MSRALSLLLLLAIPVSAVKLPGGCPTVPRTHYIFGSFVVAPSEIARGVPFSDQNASHLFKDVHSYPSHAFGMGIEIGMGHTQIDLYNVNDNYSLLARSVGNDYNGQESVTLRSAIYQRTSHGLVLSMCHSIITEDVRLWFGQSTLLIWSCVSLNSADHEEALLVIDLSKSRYDDYRRRLIDMDWYSLDLPGNLLIGVDLTGHPVSPHKDPFPCTIPGISELQFIIGGIAIITFILFLCCSVLNIW